MGYYSDKAKELGVPWYWIPGEEKYSKKVSSVPTIDPPAGSYWPIVGRSKWFSRFTSKGPTGLGCFGYKRQSGRIHTGTDIVGKHRDTVVAVTDGQLKSFYYFYNETYALFVDHGNFVINYGEVDQNSLVRFGLQVEKSKLVKGGRFKTTGFAGSIVKAGQPIALVGRLGSGSSMCHFEIYSSGITNQSWRGGPEASPPSRLVNPEHFLLKLAGKRIVKPEPRIATAVCR